VMRDLGNFGGFIVPRAINNRGQIVGFADDGQTGFGFIYTNGVLTKLDDLVPGWQINAAFGINDRGQIVAGGCSATACGSLRLDPIPE
jgi:probable HAF family extracellular repeat protein